MNLACVCNNYCHSHAYRYNIASHIIMCCVLIYTMATTKWQPLITCWGGIVANVFHHKWWCHYEAGKTTLNQTKIIKNDLKIIFRLQAKYIFSYTTLVSSDHCLLELISKLHNIVHHNNSNGQVHSNIAAAGIFLANHH